MLSYAQMDPRFRLTVSEIRDKTCYSTYRVQRGKIILIEVQSSFWLVGVPAAFAA